MISAEDLGTGAPRRPRSSLLSATENGWRSSIPLGLAEPVGYYRDAGPVDNGEPDRLNRRRSPGCRRREWPSNSHGRSATKASRFDGKRRRGGIITVRHAARSDISETGTQLVRGARRREDAAAVAAETHHRGHSDSSIFPEDRFFAQERSSQSIREQLCVGKRRSAELSLSPRRLLTVLPVASTAFLAYMIVWRLLVNSREHAS